MDEGMLETLRRKYFLRDDKGELIEHKPEEMYARVAKAIASTEEDKDEWESIFYEMMVNGIFLPNSPCLMNAGTKIGSLAACFVIDIEDSKKSIGQGVVNGMEIFASGGGVGFPFSKLRPKGDLVRSTSGEASGPVSFAHMYDAMVDTIKQGGKRRGAAMGTLSVEHPDVLEFISVKRNKLRLNNFNLSVLMTDRFMKAVEKGDEEFWARDPRTGEFRGYNKSDGTVGPIHPQEIMDSIVEGGWSDGEPGVYFIDNAQKANPFPDEDKEMAIIGSNPCGEAVLRPWESCVLGSINLTSFMDGKQFLWEEFKKYIRYAVRFLDNMIEVSVPPLEKISEATKETRKIGLGVMGLHDCLLLQGYTYSLSKSDFTRDFIHELFHCLRKTAIEASEALAIERGPFPAYERSTITTPRRNATLLSVAPTGTIARICDVSFGIEPVMHFRTQNNLVEVQYESVHWIAKQYISQGIKIPSFFEEAHDVSPEDQIELMGIVQSYVDQAISKTVNLPRSTTREDIAPLYIKAWKAGLKGFTVYRDGSREGQPISNVETPEPVEETHTHPTRERTIVMYGPSYKVRTPIGSVYTDVHHNSNKQVCEVMLQLSDGFTDTEKGLANWAARLISKCLQHGMDYDEVVKQGASTEFEHKSRAYPGQVFWFGTNGKQKPYRSIPEVVSDLIIQQVNNLAFDVDEEEQWEGPEEYLQLLPESANYCPECNSILQYSEGCLNCLCGYSKCA